MPRCSRFRRNPAAEAPSPDTSSPVVTSISVATPISLLRAGGEALAAREEATMPKPTAEPRIPRVAGHERGSGQMPVLETRAGLACAGWITLGLRCRTDG